MENYIALNASQIEGINGFFGKKIVDPELITDRRRPIQLYLGKEGDETVQIRYPDFGGYESQVLTPDSLTNLQHTCYVDEEGNSLEPTCGSATTDAEGIFPHGIDPSLIRIFMAAIAPRELSPDSQSVFDDSRVENLRRMLESSSKNGS